ncbi:MAG: YifB family Mg chelatase-like AAA ATPase [Patescibacteria group bacterium]|nr:YifB family Mg chelatase-like AAA ATPase [Patescibacteria group bacterium]MDD5490809.1 YifB family Mg chelatase-like AAA ATPase [Patescibacteria group bacterium]
MSAKVFSSAAIGLFCAPIEVEADVSSGLANFIVVGLPDTAVQESRERVRSAIKNSGFQFPRGRVAANLAPADIRKEGPAYDLPMALSLLLASEQILLKEDLSKSILVGELALDGEVRGVNGVISLMLMAREKGFEKVYLPEPNAREASLISGVKIIPVKNLSELIQFLQKEKIPPEVEPLDFQSELQNVDYGSADMAYIKGQEQAKRALEIVAAGAHNILMSGPPGSGKTFLARTIPTILPNLTVEESLEITRVYSAAGLLPPNQPVARKRPFRSPHHTASGVALVGGGTWPKPGEISLAHRGILFLDEFPEFDRRVLENLRQPLEDGVVAVSRVSGTVEFPAKFILVAAQNPCPCGYASDPKRICTCSPMQILKYQKKVSGPLLDRIDIHIEVPQIDFEKMVSDNHGESSADIRGRVEAARGRQRERFGKSGIFANSEMSSEEVKKFCPLREDTRELLRNAVAQMRLSARSYHRVLKLARTIADLAGSEEITTEYVAEALQYRPKAD